MMPTTMMPTTIQRPAVLLLLAFLWSTLPHHSGAFAPAAVSIAVRPKASTTFPLYSAADESQVTSSTNNELPQIPFVTKTVNSDRSNDLMVGEDAGLFDIQNENWGALGEAGWFTFSAAVGTILTAVAVLWVYPPTGYADDFLAFLESIAGGNPHVVTLLFGIIFPLVHSGLASLRPLGEQVVGARMWRVIFAFPSLCLAYSWITYFIAHAHDGMQFYDLSSNGIAHTVAWTINFLSFFFLYPSVFNLKEVAAVEKPQIHLWETGMIRITRHPQFVGQVMWSAAHLAMVGTSFTALTMTLLVGHHAFACWNGDRRLFDEHGEDFLKVKDRTSIVPFQAIFEGRQILPNDYYKEMLRGPYLVIAIGTLGAYFAHPYMQGGAALVRNTGLVPGGILDGLLQ
uniref:NnrU domain-containing protein n=1 Tax=Entomoneis paludosa TaxID=265537 RepID=A0A7S2VDV2_9STRA